MQGGPWSRGRECGGFAKQHLWRRAGPGRTCTPGGAAQARSAGPRRAQPAAGGGRWPAGAPPSTARGCSCTTPRPPPAARGSAPDRRPAADALHSRPRRRQVPSAQGDPMIFLKAGASAVPPGQLPLPPRSSDIHPEVCRLARGRARRRAVRPFAPRLNTPGRCEHVCRSQGKAPASQAPQLPPSTY